VSARAAPSATAQPRFRAGHAVAILVACVALLGISAVLPADVPPGTALNTTCSWKGDRLVMSGAVMNLGMSDGQFRVNSRAHIAGRLRAIHHAAFVDIPAFSARRWTSTYTYARKGLVGSAISGCVAHVRTIPPPTGED
jgi:hypothetical protein